MLEEVVVKRTSGGLLQAAADMRMGSGDRAVEELSRMLRFAALMDDAQAKGVNVSEGERNELYTLYQVRTLYSPRSALSFTPSPHTPSGQAPSPPVSGEHARHGRRHGR